MAETALNSYINEFIARQRKTGFADFKGATVTGTVPLREELINELAQQAVRDNNEKLKAVQISFRDNNIIHVKATVKVLFATPTFDIAAQVENMQTSRGIPVLRLQLVPLGGLLEAVLPILLGFLPFPESVTVTGRQVDINIHTIFTRRGLEEIAALIQMLQVRVSRGIMEIDFGLKVSG